MIWWLLLAIFLFVLSAVLIVLEIFIPSFGIITLCSVACLLGGLWLFFSYGTVWGVVGIILAAVIIPIVIVVIYKNFPKTKLGHQLLMEPQKRKPGEGVPDSERLSALMGCQGEVLTTMRPVGKCQFDSGKFECIAESGFVEKGAKIEVIKVESSQVTVREIKIEE